MKKLFLLITLLLNIIVQCQELSIEVNKNPALLGEQVLIKYTIDKKATDFVAPDFKGLRILSGPNPSTQSSYSFINGKSTSTTSTTYSFYVQATQFGDYNISPASIIVDGEQVKSKSYTLKILKENLNKKNDAINSSDKLFITAEVNKKNIVVGEQILVEYKLYARNIDLYNTEIYALPNLNGFWQKDLDNSSRFKREIINGVAYNVATVKKSVLTAQKSGKLILDPLELKCGIRIAQKRNSRDPFSSFFGSGYNIREVFIKSKAVTIIVKELSSSPKEYSGIVGDINISSKIDKNTTNANDAIKYTVTVSGKGNLELINPLNISFPTNLEIYDPKISKKIFKGGLAKSSKSFEYLIIPRAEGEYVIPEASLVTYNTSRSTFETKKTSKHTIKVIGTLDEEKSENYISKADITIDNTDIYYIQTNSNLKSKENQVINFKLFYLLLLIPTISIILLIIYDRLNKRIFNSTINKQQKANKIALKRMKNAKECIDSNNFERFFEEIEKALWGYFSDKFKVDIVNLSKETINSYFKSSSIDKDIENIFINLLDECEFARYSPSKNKSIQMDSILEKAKDIIIKVETALK